MALESVLIVVLGTLLKELEPAVAVAVAAVVAKLMARLAAGEDPADVLTETSILAEKMDLDALAAKLKHDLTA